MNRRRKTITNIILVIVLLFIFLKVTDLYLTPLRAHRASEKSIHYGPSEVVHVENFPGANISYLNMINGYLPIQSIGV